MARAALVAMNRCRAAELVAEAALRGATDAVNRIVGGEVCGDVQSQEG